MAVVVVTTVAIITISAVIRARLILIIPVVPISIVSFDATGVVAVAVEFTSVSFVGVSVTEELLSLLAAFEGAHNILVGLGVHVIHMSVAILPWVRLHELPSLCDVLDFRVTNFMTIIVLSPFNTILSIRVLIRVDFVLHWLLGP